MEFTRIKNLYVTKEIQVGRYYFLIDSVEDNENIEEAKTITFRLYRMTKSKARKGLSLDLQNDKNLGKHIIVAKKTDYFEDVVCRFCMDYMLV